MSISYDFDNDLATVFADIGTTFNWNGDNYACVHTVQINSIGNKDLQGYYKEDSVEITTRVSLFTTLPQPQETLTLDSKEYRIIRTMKDETNTGFIMECEEITA